MFNRSALCRFALAILLLVLAAGCSSRRSVPVAFGGSPPSVGATGGHAFAGGGLTAGRRAPEGPLFELQPQGARVAMGGAVTLRLVNVGDAALRHHHPAAGSSCGQFRWSVRLVAADGTVYDRDYDGLDRACLTVLVPAHDFTFEPGEVATEVTLDTSRPFFVRGDQPSTSVRRRAKRLPPGRYTVIISGAGVQARAMLTIGG